MKRMLTLVAVLAFMATGVFAQVDINYGFWGRGVFTPIAVSEGFSSVSAATATWNNAQYPRIGFTLNAQHSARTIGIQITSFWETGVPSIGENANLWVRPLAFMQNGAMHDLLEVRIGRWEINHLRGKIGAVEFGSWMVPDGVQDEDAFFTRFASNSAAHILLRPLSWWDSPWNGLTFMAAVGSSPGGLRAYMNTWPWNASDVYAGGHYALGYQIPDVGLFRLQFIGNTRPVFMEDYPFEGQQGAYRMSQGLSMNQDADVLEAAFTFTGVRSLVVEAGIKMPLQFETSLPNYVYYRAVYAGNNPWQTGGLYGLNTVEIQYPTTLSLGGTFAKDGWDTLLRVDASFGGSANDIGVREITEGMTIGVLGSASYGLTGNIRVGLDLGYNYKEIDVLTHPDGRREQIGKRTGDVETTERSDMGFAPWVQLGFSGGRIRTGIAVMLPSGERWQFAGGGSGAQRPFVQVFTGAPVISVPISVTYSF